MSSDIILAEWPSYGVTVCGAYGITVDRQRKQVAKMEQEYELRFAYEHEWQDCMSLAWRTFLKFEAQDYTEEGIQSFREFITDQTLFKLFKLGSYQLMVALDGEKIVGIISLRDDCHISLLFVDESYHHKGIGTQLVHKLASYLSSEEGITKMTVNAAPYAIGFYHRLGFVDTDTEQENDGIRYTPMICDKFS